MAGCALPHATLRSNCVDLRKEGCQGQGESKEREQRDGQNYRSTSGLLREFFGVLLGQLSQNFFHLLLCLFEVAAGVCSINLDRLDFLPCRKRIEHFLFPFTFGDIITIHNQRLRWNGLSHA